MKNLGRTEICQNEEICVVQPSLTYRLEGVNGPVQEEDDDWLDQLLRAQKQEEGLTIEFTGTGNPGDGEPEETVYQEIRKGSHSDRAAFLA
jgi:hypothetical protein